MITVDSLFCCSLAYFDFLYYHCSSVLLLYFIQIVNELVYCNLLKLGDFMKYL